MLKAREKLAQAEKDLQVVSKRNSPALILIPLIIAFFISFLIYLRHAIQYDPAIQTSRENSGSQLPPSSRLSDEALADQRVTRAIEFYHEGARLSEEGKFAEAVEKFQTAVDIDSKFNLAYEKLGYVLYRLKRYEESAEASEAAIGIHPAFKPYYNLGLVHFAKEDWQDAMLAFRRSLQWRNLYSWEDEYTQAYYYLGLSFAKAGDVHNEIRDLEHEVRFFESGAIKRFELANLYLCAGWMEAAKEQYRLLKDSDPLLAKEVLRLMDKHGVRW